MFVFLLFLGQKQFVSDLKIVKKENSISFKQIIPDTFY
jgi:hypothetical protein